VGKCLLAYSGTGLPKAVIEAGLSLRTEYTITGPVASTTGTMTTMVDWGANREPSTVEEVRLRCQ
jgi:hypothetical protein